MKTIILSLAALAIFLSGGLAHTQANSIITPQHVFSNLTVTPDSTCEPPQSFPSDGCSIVTGTVTPPQFCTPDTEGVAGNVTIVAVHMPTPQQPDAFVRILGLAQLSTADCSFSLTAANFAASLDFDGNVVAQDGASYGLIIARDRGGVTTAWDACTGRPCPPPSLTAAPTGPINAFITNAGSNSVSVISTSNNSVTATIPVGPNPTSIAVSPDGSRAYVTNAGANSVSVINTSTLTLLRNVTVGGNPVSVAITPDGTRAYVANARSNSVSVINTTTNTVIATIPVGFVPLKVAATSDGASIYVANSAARSVSVISTASNMVIATVPVGLVPGNIAIQ